MKFKPNYPIYLQVSDLICDKVLRGEWENGEKISSVKELSVTVSVNPNTVVKSLSFLQENGVLASQRGVGYFLAIDAKERITQLRKTQFIQQRLPEVFDTMCLLGMNLKELIEQYERYVGGRDQ